MGTQEIIAAIISGFSASALMLTVAVYFIKRWIAVTDETLQQLNLKIEKHHTVVNEKLENQNIKNLTSMQATERELLLNDDKIKEMITELRKELPSEYIRRQEYEIRHSQLRHDLGKVESKVDKVDGKVDQVLGILLKRNNNG